MGLRARGAGAAVEGEGERGRGEGEGGRPRTRAEPTGRLAPAPARPAETAPEGARATPGGARGAAGASCRPGGHRAPALQSRPRLGRSGIRAGTFGRGTRPVAALNWGVVECASG